MAVREVAVLGGGVSGLATAYYLASRAPARAPERLRITLLEAATRCGGWIRSTTEVRAANMHRRRGRRRRSLPTGTGRPARRPATAWLPL